MNKTSKKLLITASVMLILVGVVLILVSWIIGITTPASVVLVSIGASLFTSGVVSIFNYIYQERDERVKKVVDEWGIIEIYGLRSEMNPGSNKALKKAKSLDICAMGLKGFLDAQSKLLLARIKKGMRLRILTISPNSDYCEKVDETEGMAKGSTRESIENLIHWIEENKQFVKTQNQVEIVLYNHYPYEFYFCIDENLYVGPYENKTSQQTITYRFRKGSKGYDYYQQQFQSLWEKYK